MAKIYLINVGANMSHGSKARSPILSDDRWVYVPFPQSGEEGQPFLEETLPFVRHGRSIKCHLDPDWEGLSYGDCCKELRAVKLLDVQIGDILLFWGLLWKTGDCIFKRRNSDRGWYLFGALRVEHILKEGEQINTLNPLDIRQRVERNAHVCEGRVKEGHQERVFVGTPSYSRRFEKAVDWEVYRDGGLMQRVVKKDGQQIQWKERPFWNSVNRPCRAILLKRGIGSRVSRLRYRLGAILAANSITTVYGGGAIGSMGRLANGALGNGGKVVGVIPKFMQELEWGHSGLTKLQIVEDVRERKHRMLLGSDAVVALSVQCDVCGAVYSYEPSEVLRVEQDLPDSFKPHPLFR